ncbi:GDP-fucose protein o-fucosyltransferase 1 [Plakobranchus ocellatus]|uniref:GDP-fucose protein O-fucosyltransferase 1 n=1 Tax=Plakobranchus ocellatus TaxID=259542 RepID=A0AAV4DZ05_9GAST|nr:GDP-fucose protein o-fucosyltransferase 1 [Plakobranchus ocellatus]
MKTRSQGHKLSNPYRLSDKTVRSNSWRSPSNVPYMSIGGATKGLGGLLLSKKNAVMSINLVLFAVASLVLLVQASVSQQAEPKPIIDTNGYIAYCPCMGRFGNQADQFLGALAFAKAVNRTLIVPPWVEYRWGQRSAVMVPFKTYFKIKALSEYHRVISMEKFMKELAAEEWPVGQRKVFCYGDRHGADKGGCNAKEGNPFGPFWDWFKIDFDESVVFGPLYYDTHNHAAMHQWKIQYRPEEYPVLAFVGPPAPFPVSVYNEKLQRYVQWSNKYNNMTEEFIAENIGEDRPFIALHMRNGVDFERACEHVKESPNMFAAKQCIGERGQYGRTTYEMCFPSTDTVVKQVKEEVERLGAKSVFIATDSNDLIPDFEKAMPDIKFVKQTAPSSPHLDLAILGRADHMIGNCVSSFTAFAKRERDVRGLPTSFWAFQRKSERKNDEL